MEIGHLPSALLLKVWDIHHDSHVSDNLVYFSALQTCGVDRQHDLKDVNLGVSVACEWEDFSWPAGGTGRKNSQPSYEEIRKE